MNNKNYDGLMCEEDIKELNLFLDIMCDEYGDGMIGLSELVSVICGKDYYSNYDDEDLEYVKEVLKEMVGIDVYIDKENESVVLIFE